MGELHRDKNVATYIHFPLVDADGDPVAAAGGLDSEWDGYADGTAPNGWTDCTNEATEIGATGWYYLLLTATEMNNDYVAVQIKSTGAKTQGVLINTKIKEKLDTGFAVVDDIVTDVATVDGVVDAILVDTDTMEADLKTHMDTMKTNLDTNINANETKIDAVKAETVLIVEDTGTTIPGTITTMQADLDNPAQYKADVTDMATNTNVDANETKIDSAITKIDAVKAETATILTDTGTTIPGTITTLQGNVTSILTDTGTTLDGLIKEIGGLSNKNIYLDTTVFDGDGNMTSGRLRIYDTAANATTHGAGGLLYTLTITATYTSTNLTTYLATLA